MSKFNLLRQVSRGNHRNKFKITIKHLKDVSSINISMLMTCKHLFKISTINEVILLEAFK